MTDVQGTIPNIPQPQGQSEPQGFNQGFNQGIQNYQAQVQTPVAPTALETPVQAPVQAQQPQQAQPSQQLQQQQAPTEPPKDAPVYTGDDPITLSVQIFADSNGLDAAAFMDALEPALQYNDPNLINLSSIVADLDPAKQAQAEALAKAAYQQAIQLRENAVRTAYQKAGGEQQWRQAVDAFNSNAPSTQREFALYLEQQGRIDEAVTYVLDTVRQYGLVNTVQGQPLQGGLGGATVRGISQAEFRQQLDTLYKEVGFNNLAHDPRFKQLSDARALGKQQGL